MPRFRKKPVEVEAAQWFRGNGTPGVHADLVPCPLCPVDDGCDQPHVHTAHGDQIVKVESGDWIVPESKFPDRYYPIKGDVFLASYDPL